MREGAGAVRRARKALRNAGPALAMAARVALAAVLAWAAVAPFGGVIEDYRYYAPFGAVAVVSTTVMQSVRTSWQVLLAIGAGASLALGVVALSPPIPVGIGIVVGVGTLLTSVRWLGSHGSWVPISSLFVLLLGQGHPVLYVMGYLGLTLLGALVGVAVNFVWPPVLLTTTRQAQDALRELLVEELTDLATALDPDVEPVEVSTRRSELRRRGGGLQELISEALEGPPVNWRVHRTRDRAEQLRQRGDVLVRLAMLVSEVATSVSGDLAPKVSWGSGVNRAAARALRATAHLLEPDGRPLGEDLRSSQEAVAGLAHAIKSDFPTRGSDLFAAAELAESLRRTNAMVRGFIDE